MKLIIDEMDEAFAAEEAVIEADLRAKMNWFERWLHVPLPTRDTRSLHRVFFLRGYVRGMKSTHDLLTEQRP